MAIQFSIEYSKGPKDQKSEEVIKAISVEGAIKAKALTGFQGLTGSDPQDGGVLPEN